MKSYLIIVGVAIVGLSIGNQCLGALTPIVRTESGPMQGLVNVTGWKSVKYSSFRGVPYAMPPIGTLRLKPPVPMKPWTETLNATKEGEICPQIDGYTGLYSGSEDCLYLNVYTPETSFKGPLKLRHVMVWIHGGSYVYGSGSSVLYGPEFFIEQNVVIVTSNYRLGALGFLYLNHAEVLGNAGLKDQNLMLRWVRENIAAFGGDPNEVTIFGQSAGSSSVGYHMLSEKSRGLFNRSISQSGSPEFILYQPPEDSLQSAYVLASLFGVKSVNSDDLVKFYLQVPAEDLVKKTNIMYLFAANVTLPFRPTKENPRIAPPEDIFLSECPITLIQTGNFKKHDMIMGYTKNEFLVFEQILYSGLNIAQKVWNLIYNGSVPFDYADGNRLLENLSMIVSDIGAKGPADLHQRLMVRNNGDHPIYYYVMSYETQYQENRVFGIRSNQTSHGDDLGYLFNATIYDSPTDPDDDFNRYRQKLVALWANFAKYGNPTPKDANPISPVVWEPSGIEGRILNASVPFEMLNRYDVINNLAMLFEKILLFKTPYTSCCNSIVSPLYNISVLSP